MPPTIPSGTAQGAQRLAGRSVVGPLRQHVAVLGDGLVAPTQPLESACEVVARVVQRRRQPQRQPVDLQLATHPGTLILFNGDKLWHAVSPLGEDEERVSLTLEYVTDPSMHPAKRLFSNLKDAFAYFGLKAVFRRPARA
jgi:hypothetical protein